MHSTRSVFKYRCLVRRGGVALVLCKVVLRELPVQLHHDSVAGDLRDHTCSRDAKTPRVTLDERNSVFPVRFC